MKQLLGLLLVSSMIACGGGDGGTTTEDQGKVPQDVFETTQPEVTLEVTQEIAPEVPIEVSQPETTQEVVCTPKCEGLECGPDGCGGLCGQCADGKTCFNGKCVEECKDLPKEWGPVGVINTMNTPDKATSENICPDFGGANGTKGDNALGGLAGTINGPMADAFKKCSLGVLMEFQKVTDFANTAEFTLAGLVGEPVDEKKCEESGNGPMGEFLLEPKSYGPNCKPLIAFEKASIKDGALAAGPSTFVLSIPIQGAPLEFKLINATIKAKIEKGGADGVVAKDGVLAGVLTKQQIDEALSIAQAECDKYPPDKKPDWCSYLKMAGPLLPTLFDLDMDNDGKKDAASVCMQFTLKEATIKGYKQETPETTQ